MCYIIWKAGESSQHLNVPCVGMLETLKVVARMGHGIRTKAVSSAIEENCPLKGKINKQKNRKKKRTESVA